MIKNIKRLDSEQYLDATELGGGLLFDFGKYRFIEGTDEQDRARYIIAENSSKKVMDEVVPGVDEVAFVELSLLDFHNLCTLYILSLQDGCRDESMPLLEKDLQSVFEERNLRIKGDS